MLIVAMHLCTRSYRLRGFLATDYINSNYLLNNRRKTLLKIYVIYKLSLISIRGNKLNPVSIVGGNISGLSTAIALNEKGIDCEVHEYKLWEKPCGGAFGIGFVNTLKKLGVKVPIRKVPAVVVTNGFKTLEHLPAPIYIASRYKIQVELYELAKQKGIPIHLGKRINFKKDFDSLNPLTVVACGINRFSLSALDRPEFNDLARARYFLIHATLEGEFNECIFYLLPRKKGYAWLFPSIDGKVDIGVGGLDSGTNWNDVLNNFIIWLWRKYKLRFYYTKKDIKGWGIPFGIEKLTNIGLWKKHNGKLFVGVGDSIELVHPAFGSGIEVSWESGKHFASACNSDSKTLFDKVKYFRLIEQELNTHTRSRGSVFLTKFLRSNYIVDIASLFTPTKLLSYYFQKIQGQGLSLDFKKFKLIRQPATI